MKNTFYIILLLCQFSCTQNNSNKTEYGLHLTPAVKEYMEVNNIEFTPLEKDIIRLLMEQYEMNAEWLRIGIEQNPDMDESKRKNALLSYSYQKKIVDGDEQSTLHILKKAVKKFKKMSAKEGGMKKLFDNAVREKNWAQKSLDEIKEQYNLE